MNEILQEIIAFSWGCYQHIAIYTNEDKDITVRIREEWRFSNDARFEEISSFYTFTDIDKTHLTENTLYILGDTTDEVLNKKFETENDIEDFCNSDYRRNRDKYTNYYDAESEGFFGRSPELNRILDEPNYYSGVGADYIFYNEIIFLLKASQLRRPFENFIEFNGDYDDIINIDFYEYENLILESGEGEEDNIIDGVFYIEGKCSEGEVKVLKGDIDFMDLFAEEKYRAEEEEEEEEDDDDD